MLVAYGTQLGEGYPLVVLNSGELWIGRVVWAYGCDSLLTTIRRSRQGLIFDPFEPLIGGQGVSGRRSCLL